jgi:hypothetical protein
MKHRVDSAERMLDIAPIPDIAPTLLHRRVQIGRELGHLSVHLLTEAVEHPHSVAARKQGIRKVRTDEPRSTGD